jgi:hypothetical protein
MIFDKDDVPFIVIILGFVAWVTYSNYAFISRVDKKLEEMRELNYSLLIRQAHISTKQDVIKNRIDSLYLRNK